jgi:transposase
MWSSKTAYKTGGPIKTITLLAIDLAKNSFHIFGVDDRGAKVVSRAVRRRSLLESVVLLKPKTVAFEGCGSAHYWGQAFRDQGIEVRIIPAQFVKPFVKTNKSDSADAEAIAMAAMHPGTRFIPLKGEWHLDMQSLHRDRQQLISKRTALCNQLRAFLYERGLIASLGKKKLLSLARETLADIEKHSATLRMLLSRLLREYSDLESYLDEVDSKISSLAKEQKFTHYTQAQIFTTFWTLCCSCPKILLSI